MNFPDDPLGNADGPLGSPMRWRFCRDQVCPASAREQQRSHLRHPDAAGVRLGAPGIAIYGNAPDYQSTPRTGPAADHDACCKIIAVQAISAGLESDMAPFCGAGGVRIGVVAWLCRRLPRICPTGTGVDRRYAPHAGAREHGHAGGDLTPVPMPARAVSHAVGARRQWCLIAD